MEKAVSGYGVFIYDAAVLYYWFNHHQLCGITLAATPGSSPHEQGIAIDIQENEKWRAVLKKHNWRWRGPKDPAHFTYIGPGVTANVRKESIARSNDCGTSITSLTSLQKTEFPVTRKPAREYNLVPYRDSNHIAQR